MSPHRRRWLVALALVVGIPLALTAAVLGARSAARGMARALIVDEPLQRADAILVLGAQQMFRTIEAGALHREGWAPRIVLSPNDSTEWSRVVEAAGVRIPTFSELQISALLQMGVPREAIHRIPPGPTSTYDEARLVARLARERGWSRVIVVTSSYHTRRASLYFRREESAGLDFVIRRPRFDTTHTDRWWSMPGERIDVTLEYIKLPKVLFTRLVPASP